ncbi:DUF433 domain-containing protein [Thermodesulfatator atlanticus]
MKENWQAYIVSDPEILGGKPIIKGTRLAVDFILELLASGWTIEELLNNYPQLSQEAIKAVFAFAAECLKDEQIFDLKDVA